MAINIDNTIANSDWTKRTFDFPGVQTLDQFVRVLGLSPDPGEQRVALAGYYGLPWVDMAPAEIRDAINTAARLQGVSAMRDVDITAETRVQLEEVLALHNNRMRAEGKNRSHRTTLTSLLTVFERGVEAGGDAIYTRSQWAFGRVDAFLHLLEHHEPHQTEYDLDDDLLPEGHPKRRNP